VLIDPTRTVRGLKNIEILSSLNCRLTNQSEQVIHFLSSSDLLHSCGAIVVQLTFFEQWLVLLYFILSIHQAAYIVLHLTSTIQYSHGAIPIPSHMHPCASFTWTDDARWHRDPLLGLVSTERPVSQHPGGNG